MALRNVITLPDEMLSKKSREVTNFDDRLWVLLDDMYDTLKANNGVGMAAVQVGILRRVIVIDIDDRGLIELINPVIVHESGKQREVEGCLSNPDIWGYVKRPEFIKVRSVNRRGEPQIHEGDELFAIAVAHEIDHLDGIMFNDIADEMCDEPPEDYRQRRWRRRKRKRH